jgi:hypothetical protein
VLGARGWAGLALALVNGRLLGGWMYITYNGAWDFVDCM